MNREQLLYHSVGRHNILPLTSRCGVSCLFCSHRYNPPGVRAVFFGDLEMEIIRELLDLLNPKEKIVIGESATRLCEGEPFMHPRAGEVIRLLRRRFPRTPIQFTTNGTGLSQEMVTLLAQAGPVELIVSLNSANPRLRRQLMGPHPAEAVLAGIAGLASRGIPWHASLVLLPQITGWADVDESIAFAALHGAKSMRLLLPGFSRLAPVDWSVLAAIPAEALARLEGWRRLYPRLPITLEPALPRDLQARVAGILAHSPAEGRLLAGDEIISIAGTRPFSRVDAFYSLFFQANPRLLIKRGEEELALTLAKPARASSGIVMDWDLDPRDVERAMRMAGGAERVLLLTSQWAKPLWQLARPQWRIEAVESAFFGGNIAAAGLLTLADYRRVLAKLDLREYEAILLPPISFDEAGLDLVGEDCRALARELPAPLVWA